jgi:mannan endo-1,4-beta-mannosidase
MKKHTPWATNALPMIGRSAIIAFAVSLSVVTSFAASNGVNIQPSYYNGGNPNFGWSLMNANTKIKTVRIEVEPGYVTQAKVWIAAAKSNGHPCILTYHKSAVLGSDSTSELTTAGNWWKTNYATFAAAGNLQVNLMNEWGSHSISSNSYASAYNTAISLVRSKYSSNIVIDIPGWGQETVTAANAVKGTNGTKISDTNITLSAHVYPGAWNQGANAWLTYSQLSAMGGAGRGCMLGEFGTGSGSADWSGIVTSCKNAGWSVLGWAWNGDGNSLNMCSPSWASNGSATSFSKSSYFSTIYNKL